MCFAELYRQKRRSAEEIAAAVDSGWVCCADIAAAYPAALMSALAARGDLEGVTLHTMLDDGLNPVQQGQVAGIRPVSWFSGGGLRKAIQAGQADIMPCYYRDMPHLFTRYVQPDAFFINVSPMDRHGYFSAGVTGSNTEALLRCSKRVFLQVNDQMPRVLLGPQVHISQVTAFWEHSAPLPVLPKPEIDPVSRTIGGYIAQEIPNGATLQLGIGAVPEAVGLAL